MRPSQLRSAVPPTISKTTVTSLAHKSASLSRVTRTHWRMQCKERSPARLTASPSAATPISRPDPRDREGRGLGPRGRVHARARHRGEALRGQAVLRGADGPRPRGRPRRRDRQGADARAASAACWWSRWADVARQRLAATSPETPLAASVSSRMKTSDVMRNASSLPPRWRPRIAALTATATVTPSAQVSRNVRRSGLR